MNTDFNSTRAPEATLNLVEVIKRHAPMTDQDAIDAAKNLAGFFELLLEIQKQSESVRP